jgi:asparagine synthase (glutamine-hydrolysing)|tara:strand:+ start:3596 stop:5170 length:1575 start_codon:yes stop_codon:yes gene_type:complete
MGEPGNTTQPWTTPNGNKLVYNGEIFNYYELKEKYNDFKDTSGCDTELLAWGLDKFGLSFIDEIDSMHGFAYYDVGKNTLTLSRDHAGIKPLYYAEVTEGLIFGSEIKGMLDKVPTSRTLNKLAVSFQSRTGINPLRQTLFDGIKKLLPGETIVYDIENKKIIDNKRIYVRPNSNTSFNAEEFRNQLYQAVKRCSIGQRKIGVFLSGGLDSSVVAHELMKARGVVNSFTNRINPTVEADEDYNSDADAAKVLATKEGYNHTEVNITPDAFIDAWNDSIYFMELPTNNPSMSMYCHTNKVLAQNKIVVTIAGDMGDEILCGYPKYEKMFRAAKPNNWGELLKLWLKRMKRPLQLTEDLLPDNILLKELADCYSDELWNPGDPVASYMALDCVTQVPEEFLSRNDKYGMAYSMEGRFPLASKIFMQHCLNIPTSQKLGAGENDTKLLTKIAYKNILPDEIINKKKTGWTVPVGYWLVNKLNKRLNDFYKSAMGTDILDTVKASQKVGKTLIPRWILKDWKTKYKIK